MSEQAIPERRQKGRRLPLFAGPERKRLRASLEVAYSHLRAVPAAPASPAWAASARDLLDQADVEVRRGDLDSGWRYLHEAERLLLRGRSKAEIDACATALLLEAKQKLDGWRRQTVETLLADHADRALAGEVASGKEEPSPAVIERLAEAMQIRDEHSDNVYFRNRLLRRQIVAISLAMLCLVVGFLSITAPVTFELASDPLRGGLKINGLNVLVAMLLGGIGACLSALIGFATAGTMRIPAHLSNVLITLTRPLIGAISGLVALLVIASSSSSLSSSIWLITALGFGFSERLVLGAIGKL